MSVCSDASSLAGGDNDSSIDVTKGLNGTETEKSDKSSSEEELTAKESRDVFRLRVLVISILVLTSVSGLISVF
jgi:hypothetical protein